MTLLQEYDYLLKILLLGPSGAGKSSLLRRLTQDEFNTSYVCTIGVDFAIETMNLDGLVCKLQIWDTAGQERFRAITQSYYRNSHCAVLVYDVGDRASFNDIPRWTNELHHYVDENMPIILIGNKKDLEKQGKRKVKTEEGQRLADKYGLLFLETSAKTNANVKRAFRDLTGATISQIRRKVDYTKERVVVGPRVDCVQKERVCPCSIM